MSAVKFKFILVLIFICIVSFFILQKNKFSTKSLPVIRVSIANCNPQEKVCSVEVNNTKFEISLNRNIFYLKPFNISLVFEENSALNIKDIHIEFKMKNMNMGVNRFKMKKNAAENNKQRWDNMALLPICVTGRADWIAELEIVTDKSKYVVSFPVLVKKLAT